MTGRLRERVRIEREVRTADGGGGASLSWQTVATLWAAIEPLRGREQLEAMKLEASNLYKVTLRNPGPTITADMRLVWLTGDNEELNIREAPRVPKHQLFRVLMAEGGVGQ